MGIKVTNNAYGVLAAGITASDTTLSVGAGEGARFPSLAGGDYFYLTLVDTANNIEIVKVTARSTDTMTIVRAQDGTTAKIYPINSRAELRPCAAMFAALLAEAAAPPDFTNNYVRLSGTQFNNPQNTLSKYTLETELNDANGWWDTANHKFLPNKAGWYEVTCSWKPARAAIGVFQFQHRLYKNGVWQDELGGQVVTVSQTTNSTPGHVNCTYFVYLNGATDYIENYVYTYDYSGGGEGWVTLNHMYIRWVGI